jgi:hypothetical protein
VSDVGHRIRFALPHHHFHCEWHEVNAGRQEDCVTTDNGVIVRFHPTRTMRQSHGTHQPLMLKDLNACSAEILGHRCCKSHHFPIRTHKQATSYTQSAVISMFSRSRVYGSSFEVTIHQVRSWHADTDARIGAIAAERRSEQGGYIVCTFCWVSCSSVLWALTNQRS